MTITLWLACFPLVSNTITVTLYVSGANPAREYVIGSSDDQELLCTRDPSK